MAAATTALTPGLAECLRVSASSGRTRRNPRPRRDPPQPVRLTRSGRSRAGSDVDLLIEVDPAARFTLVELAGLERVVAGLLDRPVEFAFLSRLRERPRIWQCVRTEAINVL